MYRYYYVTLCGEYRRKYVIVFARSGEEAYRLTVEQFGLFNVSTAYTENAFAYKKPYFEYYGKVSNSDEQPYLRRKKLV